MIGKSVLATSPATEFEPVCTPPQRRCVFGDPGAQLIQVELQRLAQKMMHFLGARRRQSLAQIQGGSWPYPDFSIPLGIPFKFGVVARAD